MKRRENIRRLQRRRDFLTARIAVYESREPDRRQDYDRSEEAALTFALAVLEDVDAIGLFDRIGDLSLEERAQLREVIEDRLQRWPQRPRMLRAES